MEAGHDSRCVGVQDIVNDSKSAQMDDRDTFMGIGSNRLVRWDMRAPSGIVADMGSPSVLSYKAGHDYKTKTDFQCIATSGDTWLSIFSDGQWVALAHALVFMIATAKSGPFAQQVWHTTC